MKSNPDVNTRGTLDGNTVLHIAVKNGNSKIVGLLLYHEA